MAESPFGVSEAHSGVILDFLHFARSRRGRCLKSVEVEFQNLIESRLVEDTFTSEEVKDMVSGLCAVVNGEMETELIHTSHTHSLLVAQLLQQAETWHLNMKVDISALENKELLETLAQYEQQQFSSSALPASGFSIIYTFMSNNTFFFFSIHELNLPHSSQIYSNPIGSLRRR
jgi:leucine zipper transcription factor-like protein 1